MCAITYIYARARICQEDWKIELEPKFTKLERGAWGGLLATHSRMMATIEQDLQDRCGISHVEFEILLRLTFAEENRLRIQDLAERSVLSRSGIPVTK